MACEDTWPSTCAVGDSILLPEMPDSGNTTNVTIGSEGTSFPITGRSYGPVRKIGFHTLQNTAGQWSLGANLFAPQESLLDNRNVADTSLPLNRGRPPSAFLTATALLLLLAECLLYHLAQGRIEPWDSPASNHSGGCSFCYPCCSFCGTAWWTGRSGSSTQRSPAGRGPWCC